VTRQIVLLRGINVGAHRRVPMADLRAALAGAGFGDVKTLGQSGNVVLGGPRATAARLEQLLADALGSRIGVVVRTRDELADVIARDPFAGVADNPRFYQVTFLSAAPQAAARRAVEAADVAPERVVFDGREIYAWHPAGMQRSPLARMLGDARLGGTATARNWNTVTKLLALADAG
jgi:uncharacterized protein (DUF1697 family)